MHEKIGILGFGVVGKSALKFLKNLNNNLEITVWDQKELDFWQKQLIKSLGAKYKKIALEDFCVFNDKLLVSPGFALQNIEKYKDKCFCELDFFAQYFKQKTIAVTGTLGKTSVVSLLGNILSTSKKVITAGNIGNGMLDLLSENIKTDLAILELSSFQLALNKTFAPDLAIITNFYPNHLDWHTSEDDYFDAKCKIFEYQKKGQSLILPASFLENQNFFKKLKTIKSNIYFVGDHLISQVLHASYFYEKDNYLFLDDKKIFDLNILPDFSFRQNWLFVLATIHILGMDFKKVDFSKIFLPHRLEHFTNINGVDFYNDSKSTIMQATLAAVQKLDQKNKPIVLILGGISKGVDRKPLVEELKRIKNMKKVFCFGQVDSAFRDFEYYPSLELLVNAIMQIAKDGDQILFSPSGASFDLFKNFVHRGEEFKKLVLALR